MSSPSITLPGSDEVVTQSAGRTEEQEDPVAYLKIFFVVGLLTLGGALVANVVVDPRAEFGTGLFEPIVRMDVRAKVDALRSLDEDPMVLVLGSSRVLKLDPDVITSASGEPAAFNWGVGGGGADSMLATFRYTAATRATPNEVIIGAEVDLFQTSRETNQRARFDRDVGAYHPEGPPNIFATGGRSLTPLYLYDTARVLQYTATAYPAASVRFERDGVVEYLKAEPLVENGTYDAQAEVEREFRALLRIHRALETPEEAKVAHLRTLVEEARTAGVVVRVFMTPLHEDARALLARETEYERAHADLLAVLTSLCQEDVHVQDLTDVASFGGQPDDFYDARHMGESNARELVRALYEGAADRCAVG